MSTISVFDMAGNQVSETELNDAVFGITPNEGVMHARVQVTQDRDPHVLLSGYTVVLLSDRSPEITDTLSIER